MLVTALKMKLHWIMGTNGTLLLMGLKSQLLDSHKPLLASDFDRNAKSRSLHFPTHQDNQTKL